MVYLPTISGTPKRVSYYAKTRAEVHKKITEAKMQAQRGIPIADHRWKLGDYLDYWLENVVGTSRRPKTYELYEGIVRNYLKPELGTRHLDRLSVPIVQSFLNRKISEGHSARKAQVIRTVLSAALTRATREELLSRNVARLVELPEWQRGEVHPWSAEEARQFLSVVRTSPLYPAFLLLLLYGLRRGEVLGLRWQDIDLENEEIHVRQQLQRVGRQLLQGPVKTHAGRRDLPLLAIARDALAAQMSARSVTSPSNLVFTTSTGLPIDPNNFTRSFWRACKNNDVRFIKLHHLRHTAATLLKNLGVPARDAQLILGHSQISVTQQIYQHDDANTRREALARVEAVLTQGESPVIYNRERCRQKLPSKHFLVDQFTSIRSGGPPGTRTQDILLKSSPQPSSEDRLAAVVRAAKRRSHVSILGCVAVKTAVSHTPPANSSWQTICIRERPKAWTP
jgi:integrase